MRTNRRVTRTKASLYRILGAIDPDDRANQLRFAI